MRSLLLVGTVVAFASTAYAAIAQSFVPPAASPESSSANYTGQTNGTISNGPVVQGKSFDRFIQIWIENTDCECDPDRIACERPRAAKPHARPMQLRPPRRPRCSKASASRASSWTRSML